MKYQHHLFVCVNEKSCKRFGSEDVQLYLKRRLKELELNHLIRANKSGCLDACHLAPASVLYPEGIWYRIETLEDAELVLQQHLRHNKPVESLIINSLVS